MNTNQNETKVVCQPVASHRSGRTVSGLLLAILCLAAGTNGSLAQSTILYTTYIASSSADTSWMTVANTTELTAFNVGAPSAASTTYGGTTWLGSPAGQYAPYNDTGTITFYYSYPNVAWAPTAGGFYSGGPDLLNYGAYWQFNNNAQVDINGLTVGQDYLFQFVFADTRYDGGTLVLQGLSGVTGNSPSTTYSYTDGRYLVVNAEFTASTANTSWTPNVSGGAGEQLNGIRVLQVNAVPEPGTLTLAGLGGLVMVSAGLKRIRNRKN